MSDGEGESRSERLRRRRSQRQESAESSEQDEPSETSKSSEQSKPSEPDESMSTSESESSSVKEEQVGTYMYIPKSQKKEIERLYNVLKAEYEFEYETGFEKNRHFYPLLVKHGFDGLDGLDASEIRDRLDSI